MQHSFTKKKNSSPSSFCNDARHYTQYEKNNKNNNKKNNVTGVDEQNNVGAHVDDERNNFAGNNKTVVPGIDKTEFSGFERTSDLYIIKESHENDGGGSRFVLWLTHLPRLGLSAVMVCAAVAGIILATAYAYAYIMGDRTYIPGATSTPRM